jgi:hypothetical protein
MDVTYLRSEKSIWLVRSLRCEGTVYFFVVSSKWLMALKGEKGGGSHWGTKWVESFFSPRTVYQKVKFNPKICVALNGIDWVEHRGAQSMKWFGQPPTQSLSPGSSILLNFFDWSREKKRTEVSSLKKLFVDVVLLPSNVVNYSSKNSIMRVDYRIDHCVFLVLSNNLKAIRPPLPRSGSNPSRFHVIAVIYKWLLWCTYSVLIVLFNAREKTIKPLTIKGKSGGRNASVWRCRERNWPR